jgi:hypothetical protein
LLEWFRYHGYTWTDFRCYWRHNLWWLKWTCPTCVIWWIEDIRERKSGP